jgi:diguanylate cyclase (GGDEF)-like protein/PAS domain S-box-containing protein
MAAPSSKPIDPRELSDIFYALVEHSFAAIYVIQDFGFVYANPQTARLLGYDLATLTSGKVALDALVAPEDWPRVREGIARRQRGDEGAARYRFRAQHRDGHLLNVEIFTAPAIFRGRPAVMATLLDLSEQLVVEHDLEEQIHFMEQLLDAIPSPIFYKDSALRYAGCNLAFAQAHGKRKDEIIGKGVYDIAATPLADRYDLADRELLEAGGTQEYLAQVRFASGQLHDVKFTKAVYCARNGEVQGLVGVMLDVTDLKYNEEQLHLAARVFETTREAIVITDARGNILRVNNAFAEITGWNETEVLGRTPSFLKSGRHGADFYADLWCEVLRRGSWRGEIWNRRKNGEIYPARLSISATRDGRGNITHFIAISTDISQHKEAEARINHLAHYDALTGLPNRAFLQEQLGQLLAGANPLPLALMLLDLDRLKQINDSLGHAAGDSVIQAMAERLGRMMGPRDVICRHLGDQFALLFAEVADSREAKRIAERLLAAVLAPIELGERQLALSASIGIGLFPGDGDNAAALLRNTDTALHHAKTEGRNTFQFYRAEMNAASLERLVFEQSLRQALARGEFALYYQPQVALADGHLIGTEALLRWQHPELGLVAPSRFIALAEETGLIVDIGRWVLEQACRQTAAWSQAHGASLRVAVNLSAVQFQSVDLVGVVEAALAAAGLPPAQLELELTESMLMRDADQASTMLHRLKTLGIQLAIDDFGTGYSSLAYLRHFPLDTLKIDRSFVLEMEQDRSAVAIIDSVIALSRSLGLATVAEGVETKGQRDLLRERRCDIGQGFLFSKPVSADELEAGLADGFWGLR